MSDEARPPSSESREIERLRAELDQLKAEVARQRGAPAPEKKPPVEGASRTRGVVSGVLLVLGLLLLFFAAPAIWLQRTLLTTEGWVDAVAPLASQPAVQEAVANAAAQEFTRTVDVQAWVRAQLPEQSARLAGPIANLVAASVRQLAGVIVRTNAFAQIWREANQVTHRLLLATLSDGDRVVGVQRGALVLDLSPIVERLQAALQERGLDFTLPEGFSGQITLLQSDALATAARFAQTLDQVTPWLAFFALALLAVSVALRRDRRRALVALGIGVAFTSFLLLLGVAVARAWVTGQVPADAVFGPEAVRASYDTFTSGFVASLRAGVLVGLVVWIGAALLGPSASMVSLRGRVREDIHQLGRARKPGPAGLWVGAHRRAIQIGALLAAAVALVVPAQRSVTYVLVLTAAVVLFEALVEYVGREAPGARA